MTGPDIWVERYRNRMRWGETLRRGADGLALFLFLFGSLVLAARLALPQFWPHVLLLSVVLIPLIVGLLILSQRFGPSPVEAAALLDRRLDAGGLLMTLTESSSPRWLERLPQDEVRWRRSLPRVRWSRSLRVLLLPAAFVGGACLVPLREARTEVVPATIVGQQATQELEQMLELLDSAQVLEPRDEQELRQEIERLAADARKTPLTNEKWEALDTIRDRLAMRLDAAQQETLQASQALATLAGGAEPDGKSLSVERTAELEGKVLETLRKLSQSGRLSGSGSGQKPELQRLVQNGEIRLSDDAEVRRKQLEELRTFLDEESQKLQQLRRQQGDRQGDAAGDRTEAGAVENGDAGEQGAGDAGTTNGNTGSGAEEGAGGGPADGGASERETKSARFKDVLLPPGFLDGAGTQKVGESRTSPVVNSEGSAESSGRREFAPAVGGESWSREIRPRHRGVIREYFHDQKDSQVP